MPGNWFLSAEKQGACPEKSWDSPDPRLTSRTKKAILPVN